MMQQKPQNLLNPQNQCNPKQKNFAPLREQSKSTTLKQLTTTSKILTINTVDYTSNRIHKINAIRGKKLCASAPLRANRNSLRFPTKKSPSKNERAPINTTI